MGYEEEGTWWTGIHVSNESKKNRKKKVKGGG